MKKYIYTSSLLLFISISVNAQLIMNWDKRVSIGTETEEFVPLLMVAWVGGRFFYVANQIIGPSFSIV